MVEGAERSNHKPNNIKSSSRVPDWEASTCYLRHSLVPSLLVSILGSSCFNDGKEYQTSVTIVQLENRRGYTLGHPA